MWILGLLILVLLLGFKRFALLCLYILACWFFPILGVPALIWGLLKYAGIIS